MVSVSSLFFDGRQSLVTRHIAVATLALLGIGILILTINQQHDTKDYQAQLAPRSGNTLVASDIYGDGVRVGVYAQVVGVGTLFSIPVPPTFIFQQCSLNLSTDIITDAVIRRKQSNRRHKNSSIRHHDRPPSLLDRPSRSPGIQPLRSRRNPSSKQYPLPRRFDRSFRPSSRRRHRTIQSHASKHMGNRRQFLVLGYLDIPTPHPGHAERCLAVRKDRYARRIQGICTHHVMPCGRSHDYSYTPRYISLQGSA